MNEHDRDCAGDHVDVDAHVYAYGLVKPGESVKESCRREFASLPLDPTLALSYQGCLGLRTTHRHPYGRLTAPHHASVAASQQQSVLPAVA